MDFQGLSLKKFDPGSASRLGGSKTRKGENNKWDIKKNSDLAAMLYELVPAKAITFLHLGWKKKFGRVVRRNNAKRLQ